MGPVDGSIVPCAAGGSIPFVSENCIAVLRNIRDTYPGAWQRYSFVDAFNPLTNWYAPDVLGIDLGITTVMVENYRTSFVWDVFMRNPEARAAMEAVGFKRASGLVSRLFSERGSAARTPYRAHLPTEPARASRLRCRPC